MVANADCEVRTFVVNGRPVKHARRFTKFDQPHDDAGGKFSVFDRCGRAEALERWFDNDDKALKVGFVLSCVVCGLVALASALKNTSRASMTCNGQAVNRSDPPSFAHLLPARREADR